MIKNNNKILLPFIASLLLTMIFFVSAKNNESLKYQNGKLHSTCHQLSKSQILSLAFSTEIEDNEDDKEENTFQVHLIHSYTKKSFSSIKDYCSLYVYTFSSQTYLYSGITVYNALCNYRI